MSNTIETHVEAARAAVDAELAKQPFRAEPTWADLHAAIAAVVRYILGGSPPVEAKPPPADVAPVDADPVADLPTAEIIPLVPPVNSETPSTDQPPHAA